MLTTFEPLFEALTNLHSAGLIHRDISPDNLMLENGKIRLLDFGCARETASSDATRTIMTKHGYAPLEQYVNGRQGPWTDVYALSATIYYCITGKKPPQALDRTIEDSLVPPRKLGARLTEAQEAGLLAGMAVRPNKRTQSIKELHTALYGEPYDKPVAKWLRSLMSTKRNRLIAILGGLVVCLGVGLTLLLTRPVAPVSVQVDLTPTPAVVATDTAQPTATAEPTAEAEPTATAEPVTPTRSVRVTDMTGLKGALNDRTVADVTVINTFDIDDSLVINKQVYISSNKEISLFNMLTISGNGCLTIQKGAYLYGHGAVLRTVGGGRIVLEEGSKLMSAAGLTCLLENETDLIGIAQIRNSNDQSVQLHIINPNEGEKPISVKTLDELRASLSYNDSYIVIDGSIDAGGEELHLTAPHVVIAEGASLTASNSVVLNGCGLIVRGTLKTPMVWGHKEGDWLLNEGTVEGDITLNLNNTINAGAMEGKVASHGLLINLKDGWAPQRFYNRGPVYNYGTLLLASDDNVHEQGGIQNRSIIEVTGGLTLRNNGGIRSDGTSARFIASGHVESIDSQIQGNVLVREGGRIDNRGGSYINSVYSHCITMGDGVIEPQLSCFGSKRVFQV